MVATCHILIEDSRSKKSHGPLNLLPDAEIVWYEGRKNWCRFILLIEAIY